MKTGLSLFDLTAGLHGVAGPNANDMLMAYSDRGCLVQKMPVLIVLVTSMAAAHFLVGFESILCSDPPAAVLYESKMWLSKHVQSS